IRDLHLCCVRRVLRDRRDESDAHYIVAEDLLLHRRVWSKRHIVLVATLGILPLLNHHTNNAEWQIQNAHRLTNCVGAGEKIVSGGLTNNYYPGRATDI